jgi:DNA polymerase-1
MATSHRIHLIDASPYIFRGFFSLPSSITDSGGRPANAVFGFTDFLLKYVQEERPTHVGVAFDESLTTSFRNEIYPPYKAQRELPPAELEAQLQSCAEVARALGCATYVDERYEADDLIGTLCNQLVRKGHRVVVVSPDKDLAQLVSGKVTLYDYARERRYTSSGVLEKFGVRPAQIADLLGLAGDSVDNIPGVRGVGQKTAVALLAAYKSLDRLYDRLDTVCELDLRGARTLGAKLEAEREMAFLSRELASIALDAPARARLTELRFRGARPELVDPLFERLGFGRKRQRIGVWA